MADHCAELRVLYPGRAVGGRHSPDWDADDSQDLRLCVDGAYWFFCYETGNLKARLLIMIKL